MAAFLPSARSTWKKLISLPLAPAPQLSLGINPALSAVQKRETPDTFATGLLQHATEDMGILANIMP
ncbi:uncharacterized protein N7503_007693 [Penicillium pulvis]|uniref:uncharacterized protein n=1 Tax=Penicillium pulvis TaxID=1562058 RepID=UPI002546AA15|nr:uncharacterized protein N7503_007693 [Penicillium pulvis]KAJ5798397.1 hypothetical protein N7503_007693 [Penicillium pulvis]